jgi:transposase
VLTLSPAVHIHLCARPVDLRLGFDGLAGLVRSHLHADPLSGHLYVFFNKAADRLKVLYWDRHGFALWCKRLEQGRFHFPAAAPAGAVELTAAQFHMILDGIDLSRVRRFKRYQSPVPA